MRYVLVFASLLVPVTAAAATTAVLPIDATNLSPAQADAVGVLFASALAKHSADTILRPAELVAAQGEGTAREAATRLGADRFVEATLVKLENSLVLTAVLRDKDGAEVGRAELSAKSLDDMPPVLDRVARALVTGEPIDEVRDLHNVTAGEASAPNRRASERNGGFRVGVVLPLSPKKAMNPLIAGVAMSRFDSESYFYEFAFGMLLSTGASDELEGYGGLIAELGAALYLSDANISPYFGGGVSPRLVWGFDDGGVGFAPYAMAGVAFSRESSSRLFVELRAAQNVVPLSENRFDYTLGETRKGDKIFPTEVGLQLGLLF